ncbi:unnamed protein product [Euphydryas editha]|uniref:Uncharacterized protein n=1 Tax=Euphydryas editha TaxID=104508 RepID=A0AAU9V9Q8_EUPED|nr:unnamed protein product [Euphydryas editha]
MEKLKFEFVVKPIKATLQRRHQKRQVSISLTQELRDTYVDEDGNMQFKGYLLEEITLKTQQVFTNETSPETLTKILENYAELKKESKQYNLRNLSEKIMDKKVIDLESKIKEKSLKDRPCGICEKEKKRTRYHSESVCWFKK